MQAMLKVTWLWYRPLCLSYLLQLDLPNKTSEVCIKTRSPPASLPFRGQVTEQTTVKWSIVILYAEVESCSTSENIVSNNVRCFHTSENQMLHETFGQNFVPWVWALSWYLHECIFICMPLTCELKYCLGWTNCLVPRLWSLWLSSFIIWEFLRACLKFEIMTCHYEQDSVWNRCLY